MTEFNRRQVFQQGLAGLAAVGASSLTLRADAAPTAKTKDVHDYQNFLDKNGIPQVQPAAKWEPSRKDILGPYFLPGAPFRGKVTPPLEPGNLLVIRGRVWGHDTRKPITNAILDVWQADKQGRYDLADPRKPPAWSEFKNRIRLVTDETGYYEYETIKPGAYRIGPNPQDFRPAHIHYMIQAPGYQKLITQLYFQGDPLIASDRWASKSNLIIPLVKTKSAHGTYLQGTFDIVLARG